MTPGYLKAQREQKSITRCGDCRKYYSACHGACPWCKLGEAKKRVAELEAVVAIKPGDPQATAMNFLRKSMYLTRKEANARHVAEAKQRRSNEALRDAISCWDDLLEMAASGNGALLETHAKTMRARMVSWEEALNESPSSEVKK